MEPRFGGCRLPLLIVLLGCALPGSPTAAAAQQTRSGERELPVTGDSLPELRPFDQVVEALISEHAVPGASLAVARDGKVVYARGYGWADTLARAPVSPHHRFRIASVSKSLTAIAVLKLVEAGSLSLNDRPFEILAAGQVVDAEPTDPRISRITVQQLLRHRGGFDRTVGPDPTLTPGAVARELGVEPPVGLDEIIRFMTARPLDYEPGTRTVYSNFGYAVLGRLIEEVAGGSYEAFVRKEVLAPMGVSRMMLGRAFPDERADDEVSYHHPSDPATVAAVPPRTGKVPLPDGGFDLGLMGAHGGWIATPTDLVRLVAAVDGVAEPADILALSTVRQMVAAPEEGVDSAYYAMGWVVRPATSDSPEAWWHVGDLPGTTALLMRSGRTAWALLLNRTPWDASAHDTIRETLESAARRVSRWPGDVSGPRPTPDPQAG